MTAYYLEEVEGEEQLATQLFHCKLNSTCGRLTETTAAFDVVSPKECGEKCIISCLVGGNHSKDQTYSCGAETEKYLLMQVFWFQDVDSGLFRDSSLVSVSPWCLSQFCLKPFVG